MKQFQGILFIGCCLVFIHESSSYVLPIYKRYSEEQLRALEENSRPTFFDTAPRELIDNDYGAKIYYDEVVNNENEVIAKKTHNDNDLTVLNAVENQEVPINRFNVNNLQSGKPSTLPPPALPPQSPPPTYNYYPQNVKPNSFPDSSNNPDNAVSYDYIIFVQQYQQYLRDLLYDFYRQRQILYQIVLQQELHLKQLMNRFNLINNAISETEYEIYRVQMQSFNNGIPSNFNPNFRPTDNNDGAGYNPNMMTTIPNAIPTETMTMEQTTLPVASMMMTSTTTMSTNRDGDGDGDDMTMLNQQTPIQN